MTLNQTFNNWELITDEQDEKFYFEHIESGTRVELQEDGTMKSPAVQTDEQSVGSDTDGKSGVDTDPDRPRLYVRSNEPGALVIEDLGDEISQFATDASKNIRFVRSNGQMQVTRNALYDANSGSYVLEEDDTGDLLDLGGDGISLHSVFGAAGDEISGSGTRHFRIHSGKRSPAQGVMVNTQPAAIGTGQINTGPRNSRTLDVQGNVGADEIDDAAERVARRTLHRYESFPQASAALETSSNGSGSVTADTGRQVIQTGTTADSFALCNKRYLRAANGFSFDNRITIMFNLTQGTYNGDASGDRTYAYLGKSTPSEDTHTFEHIGVGVEAGDLSLMCADGTTRNTGGSLGGNIGNVGDTFYLVWDPSVPEVDLYRNALAANKVNPFQTLSSNVPSTSTYPDSVGVVADNDGDGHEVGMEIVEFEMGVGE